MVTLDLILGNQTTIVSGHHPEFLIASNVVLKYSSRKVTFMKDAGVTFSKKIPALIVCH